MKPLNQPQKLITERDAADLLGLSISWIQRSRWRGNGPKFIKFDRAVRYRREDIEAYIEARSGHTNTSDNNPQNPVSVPSRDSGK